VPAPLEKFSDNLQVDATCTQQDYNNGEAEKSIPSQELHISF
jgi:hypothetical protein